MADFIHVILSTSQEAYFQFFMKKVKYPHVSLSNRHFPFLTFLNFSIPIRWVSEMPQARSLGFFSLFWLGPLGSWSSGLCSGCCAVISISSKRVRQSSNRSSLLESFTRYSITIPQDQSTLVSRLKIEHKGGKDHAISSETSHPCPD